MQRRKRIEENLGTNKKFFIGKPIFSRKHSKKIPKITFLKIILKKLLIIVSIFFLVLGLFFAYHVYEKNIRFDDKLKSVVRRLDETTCKIFKPNIVNSFLEIQVDGSEDVVDSTIHLFSESIHYSIKMNNYRFSIDNLGNKGTLRDLIKTNSIFLDKKTVFKYLSSFFYRNFYIKLDQVVIINRENALDSYFYAKSMTPLKKYFNDEIDTNYYIYTDLCFDDFNNFLNFLNLTSLFKKNIEYNQNISVKSLFGLDDIKKEQLRIQILNASGVEKWGLFLEALLKSYGLNVVKLDHSNSIVNKTTISIDSDDIKDSATLKMLNYLLVNSVKNDEITNQENILSDIYVVIGTDSIN